MKPVSSLPGEGARADWEGHLTRSELGKRRAGGQDGHLGMPQGLREVPRKAVGGLWSHS